MERIDEETAQVILIGGFLIAIGVVSAVLILNDISYSQTIASQNGNSGDFGPTEFADSAERAVSEAMTGNGSDPEGARDHFEAYIQSYSKGANGLLSDEGVSANASVSISAINEAWMVGQRRTGDFNATGEVKRWIMAEEISKNYRTRFYLDVDGMNNTDDGTFVMNVTDDSTGTFDGLSNPLFGKDGWRFSMNITTSDELILNMTDVDSASGLEFATDSDEEQVDISGNKTVVVDILNETVNGAGSSFPDGTSVNPGNARGFLFEDGSKAEGRYDFRFEEGTNSFANSNGPCDHGSDTACRSADGTEKHAVGVVHSLEPNAVQLNYFGRSTSYSKAFGEGFGNLTADDVNLNQTKNVDGSSYFDVTVLNQNSPVVENSGDIEIQYEVVNTGSVPDTQDIRLVIPGANPSNLNNNTGQSISAGSTFTSSGTTNVTWNTGPNTNGTYTAYVFSENTTDTVTVTVDESDGTPDGAPSIPSGPVGFGLPSFGLETLAGVTQR